MVAKALWVPAVAVAVGAVVLCLCLARSFPGSDPSKESQIEALRQIQRLGRRQVKLRSYPLFVFDPHSFYHDFTALYATLFLAALPIAGYFTEQSPGHDGAISVSSIVRHEPLATAYAYFGAIFLYVILYFQTQHNNVARYLLAVVGAKGLSLPLILPLLSVGFDYYHLYGAAVGAAAEVLYLIWVYIDQHGEMRGSLGVFMGVSIVAMMTALVVGALAVAADLGTAANAYAIVVSEYVFGFFLVLTAKAIHVNKL